MRTVIFISFLVALIAFMATPIAASAIERRSPFEGRPNLVVRSPKKGKSSSSSSSSGEEEPQASGTAVSFGLPNHVAQLTTVGAVGAVAVAFLV
ncbi:unnamed protein product [Tuber aestivum]|uniref:Transmembrane protein n=1 Tax=Tuber aestivum TaxID=59557 RepID=A0A292PPW4_9PEZI|nr:unnamed protein product [Tuber aestivum]